MGVELLDPHTIEAGHYIGVQLPGDIYKRRLGRTFAGLAHESPVFARLVEQRAPGLDHAFSGHALR